MARQKTKGKAVGFMMFNVAYEAPVAAPTGAVDPAASIVTPPPTFEEVDGATAVSRVT